MAKVLWYILFALLACIVVCDAGNSLNGEIRFSRDMKYVYLLDSNSTIDHNIRMTLRCEVLIYLLSETDNWQDLYVSIHSPITTWITENGQFEDDNHFIGGENWFVLRQMVNGSVDSVSLPVTDMSKFSITTLKKSVARVMSVGQTNIQSLSKNVHQNGILILSSDFKIESGFEKHIQKETSVGRNGEITSVISTENLFPSNDQSIKLFNGQLSSHTSLMLQRQIPSFDSPQDKDISLVTESLSTFTRKVNDMTLVYSEVSELLHCAETEVTCKEGILKILESLTDEALTALITDVFMKLTENSMSAEETIAFLDALVEFSPNITDQLLESILFHGAVPDNVIKRALFHFTTALIPTKNSIAKFMSYVISNNFTSGVQERILLALGSMSRNMRDTNGDVSMNITQFLHGLLNDHINGKANVYRISTVVNSIGNAAHQTSIDIVKSTAFNSSINTEAQLAAIRALANYPTISDVADALEIIAQTSLHPQIQFASVSSYMKLPNTTKDLSHLLKRSVRRSKRDIASEASKYNITMPPVNWGLSFGDDNISVEATRSVMNSFDIISDPFKSEYIVSIRDESTFTTSLSLSSGNQKNDFLQTELCLEGTVTYNTNMETNYHHLKIAKQFNDFQAVVDGLIVNFGKAYESIEESEALFDDIKSDFSSSIASTSTQLLQVSTYLGLFTMDCNSVEDQNMLKLRALELADEINKTNEIAMHGLESSKQDLINMLDSILPLRLNNFLSALLKDSQPFTLKSELVPYLKYAPQAALSGIYDLYWKSGNELAELESSVHDFLELVSMYGPHSNWVNPYLYIWSVENSINELLIDIDLEEQHAIHVDESTSNLKALKDAITNHLKPALNALISSPVNVHSTTDSLSSALETIISGYDKFTQSYEQSRSTVDRIFGQRFYPGFPSQLKPCTSDFGCGNYPTTSGDLFRSGIDLIHNENDPIPAPFSGYISTYKPSLNESSYGYSVNNTILITPTEFSMDSIYFVISNIDPHHTVNATPSFIRASETIGISHLFGDYHGIHVEAYKNIGNDTFNIDPSQFVAPMLQPTATVDWDCNDITTMVNGMVVDTEDFTTSNPKIQLIGEPLVDIDTDDEEFPQPYDLVLDHATEILSKEKVEFFQSSTFLVVGVIPVTFSFHSYGQYSFNASLNAALLSQTMDIAVTPEVWGRVEGSVRVGDAVYALVDINGSLIDISLPMSINQNSGNWPLSASSNMDLILYPTSLDLTTKLMQRVGIGDSASENELESNVLWSYSISDVNIQDEFDYIGTYSDPTPPVFLPLNYANDSLCYIRQLSGRKFFNPALELEFKLSENEGLSDVYLMIGTQKNSGNILNDYLIEGERLVLPNTLSNEQDVFIAISATNQDGLESSVDCVLFNYDMSPPQARLVPYSDVSSHPNNFQVLIALFDEYGLEDEMELAVGTTPGLEGNDIKDWITIQTDLINQDSKEFSFQRSGRLIENIISGSNEVISNTDCETMCADEVKCLSYDYSDNQKRCILHSSIEGPATLPNDEFINKFSTLPLQASADFVHYEALGKGNSTVYTLTGLSLEHGENFFINLILRNKLGYTNVISSSSVLVDLTPPTPGRVRNTNETLEMKECGEMFNILHECKEETTTISNHRIIYDGSESYSVFNGPVPFVDALYTKANYFMTANWDGIEDRESGLLSYTWCISSSTDYNCDILDQENPHSSSSNYWTNTGLATFNDPLPDGKYYISVDAINNAGYGGALVTTIHHTTPYIVDTSPPIIHHLMIADYDISTNTLLIEYDVGDSGSGIKDASVSVGTTIDNTKILPWTSINVESLQDAVSNVSVTVPDGVLGWVKLRAVNNVNLQTLKTSESPIKVDRSPPLAGKVYDGKIKGVDAKYQSNTSEMCVNWKGVVDPHSGIMEMNWGVGTSPGTYDILPLQNITDDEMSDQVACAFIDLTNGEIYYSSLLATNGADTPLITTVSSNGVVIDNTEPSAGTVRDGSGSDIQYSYSLTTLSANWNGFSDPESGISHYSVTINRTKLDSDISTVVLREDNILSSSFYGNHFHFFNGDKVVVEVTAFNGAGLFTSVFSDGYLIDLTAPEVSILLDGTSSVSDLEFFSNSSYSFNWVAFDDESDILTYEFILYEIIGGKKVKVYPALEPTKVIDDSSMNKYTVDNVQFTHGNKYKALLILTNGAGLVSSFETNGAIADFMSPTVESVVVLSGIYSPSSETSTLQLGNNQQVEASWDAFDDDSGISKFYVCIVDENDNVVQAGCVTTLEGNSDGTVSGLNLTIGDKDIGPFYRVQVTAVDNVGLESNPTYSNEFWVSGEDFAGTVYDGYYPFEDIDYTFEMSSISTYFSGFFSQQCGGIVQYEWAVGLGYDDKTSVMSFTDSGINIIGNGSGYAQLPLPDLNQYQSDLFVTVRGMTGCGDIMESSSNGFRIDSTPPVINILRTGHQAIENVSTTDNIVYQTQQTFSSVWRTVEDYDDNIGINNAIVSIGSYPGGKDLMNETEIHVDHIREEIISMEGVPSYVTVSVTNGAGLQSVGYSKPVIMDTTPPDIQSLTCSVIHGIISCNWNAQDHESGIDYFLLSLASDEWDKSRIMYSEVSDLLCSTVFDITNVSSTQQPYYAILYAYNNAELEAIMRSPAIYIDISPPENDGNLYVIPNIGMKNFTDDNIEIKLSNEVVCIRYTNILQLKFTLSYDDESTITGYHVGIGRTPGGDSVSPFQKIDVEVKDDGWGYYDVRLPDVISDLSREPYYFTIRTFNDAGLYTDVTSVAVYFKSEQNYLSSWVFDGEDILKDREYQSFTSEINGNAFFGVNCPMQLVEWSIDGVDGTVVKSFTEVDLGNDNSYSFSTDQVTYANETYRLIIRGIDYSGQIHVIKSNGVIITNRELSPGIVMEGVDGLSAPSYQESLSSLTINFDGFGDGTDEQEIEYYEVALGSNEQFIHTRSDIIPFTNIGTSKMYTFTGLDLIPESQSYYTTVRAHAESGAVAEATSNGIIVGLTHIILPGGIYQTEFQYNTTFLSAYWTGFQSHVPITKYEWALGTQALNDSFLQSLCEDRTNLHESDFEVFGFEDLKTDEYGYADQLSLSHGIKYFVTLRVTDESDMCITVISDVPTVIDTLAPVINNITVGIDESRLHLPIQNEYIAYLLSDSSLMVSWKSFIDSESGIKSYEVGVFKLEKCSSGLLEDSDAIIEYIDVGLKNEFVFENIDFDFNVSYTVKVKATNNAGLVSVGKSHPIIIDNNEISAGQVKDGTSWKNDLVFQSDRTTLSGVLAIAYKKPSDNLITPCPSNRYYSLTTTDSDWSNATFTDFNGLQPTALEYSTDNTDITENGLVITARLDSQQRQVVSGVYSARLSALIGRKSLSVTVHPATGDSSLQSNIVTSMLILESPNDNYIVEYDPSVTYASVADYKALGLQIHTQNATAQQQLILWLKQSTDSVATRTVSYQLNMNISEPYKIKFEFNYEMHGLYMKSRVDVYIDGILTLALHDIPQFNDGAKFILHLFNQEGYIPHCDSLCIDPPKVTATFSDVSLPTELGEVCMHGFPFYSWGSPIVEIQAGIGTTASSADFKPMEVVYVPCRPCVPFTPCVMYGCEETCPSSDPHTVSFTFTHQAEVLDVSGSGSGVMDESDSVAGYFNSILQPTVYYLIVEALTASGQRIYETSNGVLVDITPPTQSEPILLYDVEFSLSQSSNFQGNNHTISASWGFKDLESGIVSYSWSIGTTPYGQEIQRYVSVELQTQAMNNSLEGLLKHNETYYVTVKAFNGAGLSSEVTSSGITHLSVELNETKLDNGIVVVSSRIIYDANNESLHIIDGETIGIIITTTSTEVDETSWGLGSHIDQETYSYDIFPLTTISQGASASVDHELFYINDVPHSNVSDILALSDGVSPSEITGLFLEPGRPFYHTIQFCDLAHSCILSSPRRAIYIRTSDISIEGLEGENLNFTFVQETTETMVASPLNSNHSVSIVTTGGLQKGTWMFAGFLQEKDVTREYHVDVPYISNPYHTMEQTSRELARRFSAIGGPSFFISFYGQETLNGELLVTTTFDSLLNWTTSVPRLAYWDIDNNEWREVEDTCSGSQTAINWTTNTLSVEVCSTIVDGVNIDSRPSSLARRRRNIELESGSGIDGDDFLERPVQFIVIERGNVSSNTPPKLVLDTVVTLTEDSTFTYQIPFEDAEGDEVLFYITNIPKLGVASLDSESGILTYVPCRNCYGYDVIDIYIRETNLKFGQELDSTGSLQLYISNVNDRVVSFLFEDNLSRNIWSDTQIKVYVEANRTEPVTIASVGFYDYDGYVDDMEVYISPESKGGYNTWLDVVAVPESLPVNWLSYHNDVSDFNGYIAFVGINLTYLPSDPQFIGDDELYVYAQEKDATTSDFLHILIEVIPYVCLNNGVCNGSIDDPDCTNITNRKVNPNDYSCVCPIGYSGYLCQHQNITEIEENDALESQCPGNIPRVVCDGNPCDGATCPGYRDTAECIPDYCGHCQAVWYVDNEEVKCSASQEDVCFEPIIPNLASCNGVICDCPSEPFECPEDSIYIQERVTDCCVTYSCVCPDISCPLLMDSTKNVYPLPEYRGGQYTERCCPKYNFNDIDECQDARLHMCTDHCINTDPLYSCSCSEGVTLAANGHSCGVCYYEGDEYLYGDKVQIGCNWCTCQSDNLSGERWHCTANACDPSCYYNGTTYPIHTQQFLEIASCSCDKTDSFAEWNCQLDNQ